jgi:ketosteroid isomerase-like protein
MGSLKAVSAFVLAATMPGADVSAQGTDPALALRNKTAVERSFAAWGEGTGSPYDLLAEQASWTIVGRSLASKTYPSREAFLSEVIRPFNARMSAPLRPEVRNLYADGDTVIVFFDARGTARDGKPYVNTYAWFLELRDGKVIGASAFFDSLEFNELWARVAPVAVK